MLCSIYIENLAVIAKSEITLGEGFNVFTGETGAGKTILIGAIGAILGNRVSRDMIRTGESKALVAATFKKLSKEALDTLSELGFMPEEDGTLQITRTIKQDGSDCRIGTRPATVSTLKALSGHLLDIHGQHDNARLYAPEYHLELLDLFGGHAKEIQRYQAAYREMKKTQEELAALDLDEGEKARRIDLLTYQIEEITAAEITPGEEQEITERLGVIRNSERIAASLGGAKELLNPEYSESQGLVEGIAALSDALSESARFFPGLEGIAQRISELQYELSDLSSELTDCLEELEYSPREQDDCEVRLSQLHALKLKYGASEEEILAFGERCQQELLTLTLSGERQKQLTDTYNRQLSEVVDLAKALSAARNKAGKKLSKAIGEELLFLDMKAVSISPKFTEKPLSIMGMDAVELLIAPNAGELPRPLSKIASGGEVARIMLAIKNVLSGQEGAVSAVFDEVDTGVSGRAADKIGQKLASVAKTRQVLSVTHLAQVAAYADCHLLIEKNIEDGRTFSRVYPLDEEARVREIARIVSGTQVGEAALLNAREMLENARASAR